MNKNHLFAEIKRLAQESGGTPPGSRQFHSLTHIRESDWKGQSWNDWNNWGDALEEAGFPRLVATTKSNPSHILKQLALLTRDLKKFPVTLDMRREKRRNANFPNDKVISETFGGREKVLPALIEFCTTEKLFADVLPILTNSNVTVGFRKIIDIDSNLSKEESPINDLGYVYLLKAGKYYKLGFSRSPYNRFSTLIKQSPTGGDPIHHFATDDPKGIEKYWQKRFKDKKVEALNKNSGEFYNLTAQDIAAFKRRKKFM
jgi:hypothetical protein